MPRVPLLLALFFAATHAVAQDSDLRRQLDRVYSQWRDALISRDFNGWQRSTAAHRQMAARNLIVSQKQPFPSALFVLPIQPPQTATLRLVGSSSKGNTAQLAYFGKVDLGLVESSEIPETLLLLKFVRETSGWKFDTTRVVNLHSAPEIRAALKNGGTANFLEDPEFALTGEVPPVAKACPPPERVGVLQIASFGYQTTATVNGFEVAKVQDNAEEHLVIGGLRNGDNALILEFKETPVPPDAERGLEVNALVLTGDQQKPTIKVFSWKPDGSTVPEVIKLIIAVNRITMRD